VGGAHREVAPEVTRGRVVVVVGGRVVVVVVVGAAVVGGAPPSDVDGAVEVAGVEVAGVTVGGVEVVGAVIGVVGGVIPPVGEVELLPGCSLATRTPITTVAPVEANMATRVTRRMRRLARCRDSGEWWPKRCLDGIGVVGSLDNGFRGHISTLRSGPYASMTSLEYLAKDPLNGPLGRMPRHVPVMLRR
jgi:hypothetical protein